MDEMVFGSDFTTIQTSYSYSIILSRKLPCESWLITKRGGGGCEGEATVLKRQPRADKQQIY